MRAVVQRVKRGEVQVGEKICGFIENGLVVLLGISKEDTEKDLEYIYRKVIQCRIFDDENGTMNKSLLDVDYELLLVSQFTLYGDGRKGNRPSYIRAANGKEAKTLYESFIERSKRDGIKIQTGIFGADMEVTIINDGPVTILLDSEKQF